MAIDGTEGGQITIEQAAAMTAEFRRLHPESILAHTFGRNCIKALLEQDECMGIRMYYGINVTTGAKELVLVGVNANDEDMTSLIMDISKPCPGPTPTNRKNRLNA